jgi:serine-type D-Ala-D-Ala endopeptidase (penicillin-binding protein 7)
VWSVNKQKRNWRAGAWSSCLGFCLAVSLALAVQPVLAKTSETTKKTSKYAEGKAANKVAHKGAHKGTGKSDPKVSARQQTKAGSGKHGAPNASAKAAKSVKPEKLTVGSKGKLKETQVAKASKFAKDSPGQSKVAKSPSTRQNLRKAQRLTAIKLARSSKHASRHVARVQRVSQIARVIEPAKPSLGQAIGLHSVDDPLGLRSSVALVADAQTGQVLYEKNGGVVLPIASITKLMTAMVVLDSKANLQAGLEVTEDDRDQERNSRSRLPMGSRLTRLELLNLALMSSENRAASALGRHHPGGESAFVQEMNAKARALGLSDTAFTESTGLSSANVSTARDLAKLVQGAARYPLIRELSTAAELTVDTGLRQITFRNTNRLVGAESWGVQLQKTGYISEAGQCLVMMARWAERPVIMIFLDSIGRHSRLGDAQRVREWLDSRGSEQRTQEPRGQEPRAKLQNQSRNLKSVTRVEAQG